MRSPAFFRCFEKGLQIATPILAIQPTIRRILFAFCYTTHSQLRAEGNSRSFASLHRASARIENSVTRRFVRQVTRGALREASSSCLPFGLSWRHELPLS